MKRTVLLLVTVAGLAACGTSDRAAKDVGHSEDARSDAGADVRADGAQGEAVEPADSGDLAADADVGADTGLPPPEREIDLQIETSPFSATFRHQGKLLLTLGGQQPAFGLKLKAKSVMMASVSEVSKDEYGQKFEVELEDGRTAALDFAWRQNGAVEVAFVPSSKAPDERILANFTVTATEGFSGMMERVVQGVQELSWDPDRTEGLDLRGQAFELIVLATISLYTPFFVSTQGYGFYVDSDWPGKYDFGKTSATLFALDYEGPELRFQVFPEPTPQRAIERFAKTVGTTTMPAKWALGHYRWRDDHYHLPNFYDGTPYDGPFNTMVVEDILMMEALGIPSTLYWVDRPWGPGDFGYDDFLYDEKRLPNPLKMIDWLAGKGIKFMLWICPWAVGEMAQEAVDKGYEYDSVLPTGPQDAKLIDFTIPEARTWWQDAMIPRIKEGVVGFKLDRGEEKNPDGYFITGNVADGRSYREMHNAYLALYAKTVREAFERAGVPDGVVMPRGGWRTTSHYATPWGGDTAPTQHGLRSAIIAQQRCATMNIPIWGSDTCGYGGTAPQEVCSRWLGFSAFSPIMEVGPTGNVAFWSWPNEGVEASVGWDGYHFEPQFNEQLVAEYILYANLHMDLLDYIYAQAQLAHQEGTPIIRPMFLLEPDVPAYMLAWDQYLFGPDILVAPVWESGKTSRTVLIPEGTWVDAWEGTSVQGPTTVTVDAPEHKIPFFIRQGSQVNVGDMQQRWVDAQEKATLRPDLGELVKSLPVP